MKQIGILGLCFGILISGVRGQEVMQQSRLTGFTDIAVQDNEVCEIFYIAPTDTGSFYPPLCLVPLNFSFDEVTDPVSHFNSNSIKLWNTGANLNIPIIGPIKIFLTRPNELPSNYPHYGGAATVDLIVYRVISKTSYSPNISPTSLAANTNFVSGLTQTILSSSNSYGLATRTELIQALAESRADGINSVISNPNLWTLYTTNQIHAMAIGDLVLTSTNNGQFVLNYDIEQSEDLVNWTPYQGFAMPLTNLPTNKAFVRIKAKQ